MEKTITLTTQQARDLIGQNEALDKLIRANFTEEELRPEVTRWEDLGRINGWYITTNSTIREAEIDVFDDIKNTFATQNQARSALAMAQLSQLMQREWDTNGGGWRPEWNRGMSLEHLKYCIYPHGFGISVCTSYEYVYFLAFPTAGMRDRFLENHRELIEEYFLMYKY